MSDSTMTTDKWGTKRWTNSRGLYHQIDGPALEFKNGHKEWWLSGKLHRINGPAVEWANGEKVWWVNGKRLGFGDEGFWKLWDRLTPEQKQDSVLLSYLPEKF